MQIFVDESGNLGTKGRFFVITALIPQNPKRLKNIIKSSCVKFGSNGTPLEEIKGCKLDFTQKQDIFQRFGSKDDFSCSYIVADKKHLNSKVFNDKNLCYNYLANYLFKPIIKGASEDIEVILDNHTTKVASVNSLEDYIKIKSWTEWGFKNEIAFCYKDSKDCKNLQAVDLMSNAIYQRYDYNKKHIYSLFKRHILYCIKFPFAKFGT
jgi:hypothetical protein